MKDVQITSKKTKAKHGNRSSTSVEKIAEKVESNLLHGEDKYLRISDINFDHLNNRPLIQHPEELQDKISSNEEYFDKYKESVVFDLVDMNHLGKLIFQNLSCGECHQNKCLNLRVHKRIGVASYFVLSCTTPTCNFSMNFGNSKRVIYKLVEQPRDKQHDQPSGEDINEISDDYENSSEEESDEDFDENDEQDENGNEERSNERSDEISNERSAEISDDISNEISNERSDEISDDPTDRQSDEQHFREVKFETMNIALVNAARLFGLGHTDAKNFCTYMNLNNPPNEHIWIDIQDHLHVAYQKRAEWSMNRAVEEAKQQAMVTTGTEDLTASFDGTWMKRGFQSLVGLVSCIGVFTNKIIGIDVLHKYCPMCKGNDECKYGDKCRINYQGSSGGMEPVGAVSIIKKIYDSYKVKITQYLGDGDSKAFALVKSTINWPIEKLECINHISKRMGGRLRKRVKENKTFKFEGREGLGGKGRLTGQAIDKIQQYYSWIIYRSKSEVEKMRKGVLAMFNHIASSNDESNHEDCDPVFCKHQLAIASETSYRHEEHFHIPRAVMAEVNDIFQDLSRVDLLEKVAHGKTQNANECANSTIWNILSKNGFANRPLVELAAYMAVCLYNEGKIAVLDVLSSLAVPIGKEMAQKCKSIDKRRIYKKRKAEEYKSNRQKRRKTGERNDGQYEAGMGEYN